MQTLVHLALVLLMPAYISQQLGRSRGRVQTAVVLVRYARLTFSNQRVIRIAGQRLEELIPDPNFVLRAIARIPQGVQWNGR